MEERGAHAATMAAIAERAGVTRRSVYLHFASRADLVMALHDHVNEALSIDSWLRPLHEAASADDLLEAFAALIAGLHVEMLAINLAVDRARHDDAEVSELWRRGVDAWLRGCRQIMARLEEQGRLAAPWTVDTASDQLFALMSPHYLAWLVQERGLSGEQVRTSLSLLLRRAFLD